MLKKVLVLMCTVSDGDKALDALVNGEYFYNQGNSRVPAWGTGVATIIPEVDGQMFPSLRWRGAAVS